MIHSAFIKLKHPDGRKHTLNVVVTEASDERAFIAIAAKVDEVVKHLDETHGAGWNLHDMFLVDQTLISLTT